MVAFCPLCSNILFAQESVSRCIQLVCNVCPVYFPIRRPLSSRSYYHLKELDDVLGSEETWKHVNSTAQTCPKCSHDQAYFLQLQTRSADEPMTTFYRCCNTECKYNWKD